MKNNPIFFVCLSLMALLLAFPRLCSSAVAEALRLCAFTVVPSLFPFAVLCNMLIRSGSSVSDGILARIFSKAFRLPSSLFSAYISGLTGGYPIGAISVCELFKSSLCSKEEAEKALSFASNCGPAFIISAVGTGILQNPVCGLYLYVCHVISSLITGFLLRPFFCHTISSHSVPKRNTSFPQLFTMSIKTGADSMITVSACIMLFSVIIELLNKIDFFPAFFNGYIEMTSGIRSLNSSVPSLLFLPVISTFFGFGGISVHAQVVAVCSECNLRLTPYYIGKSLQAVVAFAITLISQRLLGEKAVFSYSTALSPSAPSVLAVSLIMLLMLCLKKEWKSRV